jgi:methylase of polypeptide subunit release factors
MSSVGRLLNRSGGGSLATKNGKYCIVSYKNIRVNFLPHLEGGGRNFGQEFIRVIRDRTGKVEHIFEYCAGPGFIGFSLLAHGLCEKLTLADVNPEAVKCCKQTVADNRLEGVVSVYLSDCLTQIPTEEKWDVVVSNPPHWLSDEDKYRQNIRNFDPDFIVHKNFYRDIHKFLKPGGTVLFQECEPATTSEDFLTMIEAAGLHVVDVFKARPFSLFECIIKAKNIRKRMQYSSFYFIESKFT